MKVTAWQVFPTRDTSEAVALLGKKNLNIPQKLCVKTNCYFNGVPGRIHNIITTIIEREKSQTGS